MSAVESLQDIPQATRKARQGLTIPEKQAIVAACSQPGAHKGNIAKQFNVRPEVVSRLLRDVKAVQNDANPLAKDWKERVMPKLQRTVERGLDYKGDPIGAANMAVKVMYGAGYLSTSSKVEVDADVRLTVAWQPVQGAEYASGVQSVDSTIDAQHKMLSDGSGDKIEP